MVDREIAFNVLLLSFTLIGLRVNAEDGTSEMDLMKQICDRVEDVSAHSGRVVCKVCPEVTSFAASAAGLEFQEMHFGSFTGPDQDEVFVLLNGCEPHAAGFAGMALLRREKSRWRKSFYAPGSSFSRCEPYGTESGIDELFCQAHYGAQGTGETWFSQISIKDASLSVNMILDGVFVTNNAGGRPGKYCCSVMPVLWKLTSSKNTPRIRIDIHAAKSQAAGENELGCLSDLPPPMEFTLFLEYDGRSFVVLLSENQLAAIKTFCSSCSWPGHHLSGILHTSFFNATLCLF